MRFDSDHLTAFRPFRAELFRPAAGVTVAEFTFGLPPISVANTQTLMFTESQSGSELRMVGKTVLVIQAETATLPKRAIGKLVVATMSPVLTLRRAAAKAVGAVQSASAPTVVLPSIAGLQLWLDASQITGKTDGDTVSTWHDQSGHSADATSSWGLPTFRAAVLNGKPVVRFVAANSDHMEAFPAAGVPYTAFVVARMNGGSNQRILGSIYPTFENYLIGWWNGFEDEMYAEGFVNNPGTPATTNWHRYEAVGTGSLTSLYDAGALIASNNGGVAGFNNAVSLSGYAPGSELSDFDIAELIIFGSALSDPDRQSVEAYLTAKYFQAPAGAPVVFVRAVGHRVAAAQAAAGTFARAAAHSIGATVTTSLSLTVLHAKTIALAFTQGASATYRRAVGKAVAASESETASLPVRALAKSFLAAESAVGSFGRSVAHRVAATAGSAATVAKAVARSSSWTQGESLTVRKAAGKALSTIGQGSAATYRRAVARAQAVAMSSTASFPARAVAKLILATETAGVTLKRAVTHTAATTQTESATESKGLARTLSVVAQSGAAMRRAAGKLETTAQSETASVPKRAIAKGILATATATANLGKGIGKSVAAVATETGTLAARSARSVALTVTQGAAAAYRRASMKAIGAAQNESSTLKRGVAHGFLATTATAATFGKGVGKAIQWAQTTVARLVAAVVDAFPPRFTAGRIQAGWEGLPIEAGWAMSRPETGWQALPGAVYSWEADRIVADSWAAGVVMV